MAIFSRNWLLAVTTACFLAACGGDGDSSSAGGGGGGGGGGGTPPPVDVYADSSEAPPATIVNPTISASGAIAPKAGSDDLFEINIAGFAAPTAARLSARQLSMRSSINKAAAPRANITGAAVPDLTEDDFTVVELGTVKGITVKRIGEGETRAKADVVFVFDTTGSMGSGLTSVKNSIIEFADFLDSSGLDVNLGAVTFGDAFDVRSEASTQIGTGSTVPPSFDPYDRQVFPLTADTERFKTFIGNETPEDGNNTPENAVGALQYAYDSMTWREGAQRIVILITDVYSHNASTYTEDSIAGRWIPPSEADLLAKLKGKMTVHVVSPELVNASPYTDMKVFTGAAGTGGSFVPYGLGTFNLIDLPIAEVAAGGYVVTFRGTKDGLPKTIRVVIDDGGEIRGEFGIDATY